LSGINAAKMPRIERRLARFLANERSVVTEGWKRFMQEVLPFWRRRQVSVVLDCTPRDDRACVVSLGLLVQSRLLPIAWRVLPNQETWDQGQWDLVAQLLDQVRRHLHETECTLIAARGLAGFPLVKLCRARGWHSLLRVWKEHPCRRPFRSKWQWWTPLGHIILREGQQWFGWVQLWQEDTLETSVSAVWEPGYKDPWFLISARRACPRRVQEDAWRMRVESTFEDFKSRGGNLEATKVSDRARLDRL
jgi:hypothetical protein